MTTSGPRLRRHEVDRGRVVDLVRRNGQMERSELAHALGLSRTTVSLLVEDLLRQGVLREAVAGRTGPKGGRPPRLLRLAPNPDLMLIATLSSTRATLVVAGADGNVLAQSHRALPDSTPDVHVRTAATGLLSLLAEVGRRQADVRLVVLGLPVPVNQRTGRVTTALGSGTAPAHRPARWATVDPVTVVRAVIGGVEVLLENDANLAAVGEVHAGAGRGARDVIYVRSVPGLGAGLVLGGALYRGWAGAAGELAHVQVRDDGPPCFCGGTGCLIEYADVGALVRAAARADADIATLEDLSRSVRSGIPGPARHVLSAGRILGRVLADACNLLNLELVILDKELDAVAGLLADGVRLAIQQYAQPTSSTARVTLGELGAQAEIQGAVALGAEVLPTTPRTLRAAPAARG